MIEVGKEETLPYNKMHSHTRNMIKIVTNTNTKNDNNSFSINAESILEIVRLGL